MPRLRKSLRVLSASLTVAALCPAVHALERVTLSNGFTYDCTRREPVDSGRVRLFLPANAANTTAQPDNYIDLPANLITSIQPLPDPPKPPAPMPAPPATFSVADVHDLLARAGAQHNIDVELLASIVRTESAGHAAAVSRAGARGLMQLMPSTARDLGVQDAFRPDQNIAGGVAYLDGLLTRYSNNLALALAAYNAGPGAVDRFHGIPPYRETRAYVVRVMTEFKRRKLAAEKSIAQAETPHTVTVASR